jgi:hypothetical protein
MSTSTEGLFNVFHGNNKGAATMRRFPIGIIYIKPRGHTV